jgi:biopolymer transport protein ExbD
MRFETADEEGNEINMTPMIDCVFLLLIFFLVATVVKKVEKELPVQLPDAIHAVDTKYGDQRPLVLGVDNEGQFYLNGEPATLATLHGKLRETATTAPETRIRIDGDQAATFQSLTHLLDLCAFEGLKVVGIHTANDPQKTSSMK